MAEHTLFPTVHKTVSAKLTSSTPGNGPCFIDRVVELF